MSEKSPSRQGSWKTFFSESPGGRFLVGIGSAVALHAAIVTSGGVVMSLLERYFRYEVISDPNWVGMILWLSVTRWLWHFGKPRLREWGWPFLLFIGFWFFTDDLHGLHPDTPEEVEYAIFASAMFLACGSVLGLAMIRSAIRFTWNERKVIKRTFQSMLPVPPSPPEILLRPSSPSPGSSNTLLRASQDMPEAHPDQLLRANMPETDRNNRESLELE